MIIHEPGSHSGCDHMKVMQSVPIITKVVSLNPTYGEVYWTILYDTICQ